MSAHELSPLIVPGDFWARDHVRSALRSRDVGSLFRLLRKYAAASQTQIGMAVGLEQGYVSKIMNSRRKVESIDLLERIALGFAMPDQCRMLFGLAPRGPICQGDIAVDDNGPTAAFITQHVRSDNSVVGTAEGWTSAPIGGAEPGAFEWPEWFGVRLAHVIGMVDSWQGQDAPSDILQTLLHEEMLMFDAIARDGQHPAYAFSRRQALATIAALPLTSSFFGRGPRSTGATTEFFLTRCAASLTACWHILKGSDLNAVHRVLSAYLLELEAIAQRPSPYQATAARLASQAHRICGIIALHRDQLRMREHHCRRALYYAAAASDIPSRASALISLASTYFYDAAPAKAAAVYEQALSFASAMSPLQQSRVNAELSVVLGQLGREQETIRSAGLAEQLYPEHPEQDASFLYAEFTRASLTLERGLSYIALAERHPNRKYQRIAADIFARVEHQAQTEVPDRIRYEIINHQARTAVLLNDLDAFDVYISRGVDGAAMLSSKQRQKELQTVWKCAAEAWPNERRLKAICEQLPPSITRQRQPIEGSG